MHHTSGQPSLALEPDAAQTDQLLAAAGELVQELLEEHRTGAVLGRPGGRELAADLLRARPGADGRPVTEVLDVLRAVLATGTDNAAAGELAYIPGSGLLTASVADLLAGVANRYTGLAAFTPAAVALEQSVLSWLTESFDLPATAQALLLSGGSAANLTALVVAREASGVRPLERACLYVGEHAHASVLKAARIAGFDPAMVRVCPTTDGLRIDPEAVRIRIKQDLADGLVPVAVVAAAGTTNTGAIDDLDALADVADEYGCWFHVDAAYGGFFRLTGRGRERLAGIERADSITLDPHKSLFLPFGTGALLVRDRARLVAAFGGEADYLRDAVEDDAALPDLASLGPELTRQWRGLRLWLPLMLHGTDAFRAALDRALDLARWAAAELDADEHVEVVSPPELSILTFRVPGDDAAQDTVLQRIHADGRVRLSSTVLEGRVVLRLAVLSHRTDADTVALAVRLIREAAAAGATP